MKSQPKIHVAIGVMVFGLTASIAFTADNAVIKNKLLSAQRQEIDTAITLRKINGLAIDDLQDQTEVSPGEHTLEIECIVRTFVGMGTVDLGKLKQFTLPLDAGRIYQLGAKLSPDGECTPTID